jgi:hypothetical protein
LPVRSSSSQRSARRSSRPQTNRPAHASGRGGAAAGSPAAEPVPYRAPGATDEDVLRPLATDQLAMPAEEGLRADVQNGTRLGEAELWLKVVSRRRSVGCQRGRRTLRSRTRSGDGGQAPQPRA